MNYRQHFGRLARFLACASLLAVSLPAASQEGPTSLLPPMEPAAPPSPAQAPGGQPKSLLPEELAPPPPPPVVLPTPMVRAPTVAPESDVGADEQADVAEAAPAESAPDPMGPNELPEHAGLLTPRSGGYDAALFAGADGRFLSTLLRRIDAPLASRWAQIMVQRALLSRAGPPLGIAPGDWVAARGMALVAMGSATDAHRMIQRIAIDRYTENLYMAAAEAALAAADPIALCPLSETARALTELPAWTMADGMCAAVFGDDYGASVQFDRVRGRKLVKSLDVGLAERIASAAGTGQSGANPTWDEVSNLTSWRIGLASAAGLAIPDSLVESATPTQRAWMARLPGESLERRTLLAPAAAAFGVLSSAEVNRVMAAQALTLDPRAASTSPGGLLRRAHAADNVGDRLAALEELWQRGDDSITRYGWLVATALPAARIPVRPEAAKDAPLLAAALVSAGLTGQAARWWPASEQESDGLRAQLWAAIVAVSPDLPATSALYAEWAEQVPAHRAQLLAAGLRGLGRGDVGGELPTVDNSWTRALTRAAEAGHAGEVMILTATGLQGGWGNVHPDYLRRIAAALVAVGRTSEAQMIVAEAAIRG